MTSWLAQADEQGATVLRVGRNGPDLIAEWPGIGRLRVDRAGRHPRFECAPDADQFVASKIQATAVPALLRHLKGELTLHAAAVATKGSAMAFIGDPGAGKSTLAFAASSMPCRTSALLTDDALFIDKLGRALPTTDEGWLDGPARAAMRLAPSNAKEPARPSRVAQRAAQLKLVAHLTFASDLRVRRLRGHEAARVLGGAMIRFVLDEPAVHRADLERLAYLATRVHVVSVERPHGFQHLRSVLEVLDAELGEALERR